MGDRVDEIRSIQGFLVPVYSDDEIAGRESRHALTPRDFQKVVEGYACPRCLADFGQYRPVCPLCHHERDINADIVRAYDWEQHDRARKHAEENPKRTRTPRMDERVDAFMRSRS